MMICGLKWRSEDTNVGTKIETGHKVSENDSVLSIRLKCCQIKFDERGRITSNNRKAGVNAVDLVNRF